MERLKHTNIDHLCMDVTDDASVKAAIDQIIANEGRIDVLVNNAGVMHTGKQLSTFTFKLTDTYMFTRSRH